MTKDLPLDLLLLVYKKYFPAVTVDYFSDFTLSSTIQNYNKETHLGNYEQAIISFIHRTKAAKYLPITSNKSSPEFFRTELGSNPERKMAAVAESIGAKLK